MAISPLYTSLSEKSWAIYSPSLAKYVTPHWGVTPSPTAAEKCEHGLQDAMARQMILDNFYHRADWRVVRLVQNQDERWRRAHPQLLKCATPKCVTEADATCEFCAVNMCAACMRLTPPDQPVCEQCISGKEVVC